MTQGNKEKEIEKLRLGFLGYLYAFAHFKPACADVPPETLTQKLRNKAEMKTKETNNLTCF